MLDRRFESRFTTVVAGAGFGKSTLVGGAVRANLTSPLGDDCWLGCEPGDADALHLAAGLHRALDRNGTAGAHAIDTDRSVDAIAESIWGRAPRHVALVLDDVHEIPPGSTGAALIDQLARSMPANGHLVLVSRSRPPISLSRARSHGSVIDLTESDLTFTADELAQFAALRDTDVDRLARVGGWPALAELAAGVRNQDVDGFLFEEVLADRPTADVEAIETLAIVGGGDHELLGAMLGRPISPEGLARTLGAVPLASCDAGGWWTLHPLWTRAMEDRLPPGRRRDALRRAGQVMRPRDPARAIELLADADDVAELVTAVRSLLGTPWAEVPVERLRALHRRLPDCVVATDEAKLLLAAATSASDPVTAQTTLRSVADRAEAVGDHGLGLLAVARLVVITHRRQDVIGLIDAFTRAQRLARHDPVRAGALVALGDALVAEAAGDAELVLARLEQLDPDELDRYWLAAIAWMRAQALLALGHPRSALHHSTVAVETAPLPLRGELSMLHVNVLAHAGEVDAALELIPDTIELLDRFGTIEARTMAHGQAVQRYALRGSVDAARRHLGIALDLAGPHPPPPVQANLAAAMAILAVADLDEDRARQVMAEAIAQQPLGVGRQQYHERRRLALSYVLLAHTRAFWDEQPLGPAFALTRQSAHALVALREAGDVQPAGRLEAAAWAGAPAALPVPWIVELALAGVVAGSDAASRVLGALQPDDVPILQQIVERTPVGAVARLGRERIAALPAVPSHRVGIDALGTLAARLEDVDVDEPKWRRGRVRALLAYLVSRRQTTREAAAAALWPDLDGASADRNLRVTLSYLQAVLEPTRRPGAPPYFVRTDGGRLVLAESQLLTVDVDEFLVAVDRAAAERRDGSPTVELDHLLRAVDLYRGSFLADLGPEEWLLDERDRLRARFVAAAVRAGDLVLARGDIDQARNLADRAVAEEPWSEAARRLLVAAHLEGGDRAAARRAMTACCAMLDELGVGPEVETQILVRRLGGGF